MISHAALPHRFRSAPWPFLVIGLPVEAPFGHLDQEIAHGRQPTALVAAGPKARPHILFWGGALALVVGGLLVSGGTSAIQTAMVIGALPFSIVMVLMCFALIKAIYNDGRREAAGVQAVVDAPVEV